jgi:hypothetical protein
VLKVVWPSLNKEFGSSAVSSYACESYHKASKTGDLSIILSLRDMADIIRDQYSDSPYCYEAVLDSLVNKFNLTHVEEYGRGFAQIFMFRSIGILTSMYRSSSGPSPSYKRSDFTSLTNLPPYITDNPEVVPLTVIKSRFPVFFAVLSDENLERLKTCSPAILRPLKENRWMEEVQLRGYCPVDTWPVAH